MGLFGKKTDSKARIEELKRKIQAEQAAMNQGAAPTPQPPAAPAPQPAAAPQAPPAPAAPASQPTPQPAYEEELVDEPEPQPAPRQHRRRMIEPEELFEEEPMEEIKTGIILDLGEGMSLNLPIRSRMRLDEFLHIADRVRELQRLQHPGQY